MSLKADTYEAYAIDRADTFVDRLAVATYESLVVDVYQFVDG